MHPIPAYNKSAVKHAYLDELAAFARRGQSLIVYHHADRTTTVSQQALRRLDDLAAEVPAEPIAAVRASRGTVRLYLIAAATGSHSEYLKAGLRRLQSSPWRDQFLVYWRDPTLEAPAGSEIEMIPAPGGQLTWTGGQLPGRTRATGGSGVGGT